MQRFTDRVAIVTGGGSGIAQALCRLLAGEGAHVVVADVDDEAARATAAELASAQAVALDIADSAQVDEVFDSVVRQRGRLDICANVAGIDPPVDWKRHVREVMTAEVGNELPPTAQLSDAQWRRSIDVNLTGTFHCVRAALRIMAPRRSGVIVNTSSGAALTGAAGMPDYTAGKAGVIGLTRAVAREAIRYGIRVNAVAPGPTDTPLLRRGNLGATLPPLIGRVAEPEEIARTIMHLCSDESSYVVGETLNVSGGWFIG